jgi:Uma2 family endonuclease
VGVAFDYGHGPYTVEDLHALPDAGKSFELVDGWLIELTPSTRHDYLGNRLQRILQQCAEDAGAQVYVQAPMDISTVSGARRPDVAVIGAAEARDAREMGLSLYPGTQVLLAAEIVSRGSGSEREDRGRKVVEYAQTGIGQYWIVDFDPRPQVQILRLEGERYAAPVVFDESDTVEIVDPFPITLSVRVLADFG